MTWPRTTAQVPINIGDPNYQPLYPYGWGLRTDRGRDRLAAVAGSRPGPAVRSLLAAGNWRSDGSLRDDARTLGTAARALTGSSAALRDAVLSLVRDAAQARVVAGHAPAGWAATLADADHAQASGATSRAFTLLRRVAAG
jgi:beta-glucosidase